MGPLALVQSLSLNKENINSINREIQISSRNKMKVDNYKILIIQLEDQLMIIPKMMKTLTAIILIGLGILSSSCNNKNDTLTELERNEIINSAKATVEKVFESSNNLEFVNGLNHYSDEPNSFYISDGKILSLEELKASYNEIGPSVEVLKNSIDSWNTKIISKDAVSFTLPVHLKLKLKGIPEYNGQLVWTAIVQKKNKRWKVVQSHESWLNCAEVSAALTRTSDLFD